MVEINGYVKHLIELLNEAFHERLLYVGLQGSYLRGEADENSDIDIMVVLETLSESDLKIYKEIINQTVSAEKACGFICGRAELERWNPCEICQLTHTTKDFYGSLAGLVPDYTEEDESLYIKICLNNLYHELCHSYIHASNEANNERLKYIYKSVFFILQNLHYLNTDNFVLSKSKLVSELSGQDRLVLSLALKQDSRFDTVFGSLLEWCKNKMYEI